MREAGINAFRRNKCPSQRDEMMLIGSSIDICILGSTDAVETLYAQLEAKFPLNVRKACYVVLAKEKGILSIMI